MRFRHVSFNDDVSEEEALPGRQKYMMRHSEKRYARERVY